MLAVHAGLSLMSSFLILSIRVYPTTLLRNFILKSVYCFCVTFYVSDIHFCTSIRIGYSFMNLVVVVGVYYSKVRTRVCSCVGNPLLLTTIKPINLVPNYGKERDVVYLLQHNEAILILKRKYSKIYTIYTKSPLNIT